MIDLRQQFFQKLAKIGLNQQRHRWYHLNWAICVAASFRLRNLREIHIHPLDVENRRLKPAATIIFKIKSLNLGILL